MMEFCNSFKAAKFFVELIFLITILFLIRVESQIVLKPQDINTILSRSKASRLHNSRLAPPLTNSSPFASSPTTFESATQKTLPESSIADTSKPLEPVPKWKSDVSRQITRLLSPSTLSQDLFEYLVREISVIPTWKLVGLRYELDSRLETNQISENGTAYARALRAIIVAEIALQQVKFYRKEIRNNWRYIPPEVSSPPALSSYGLFSSDIFADPDNPLQLIKKLIEIPKSEISNIIIQLENYLKMWKKHGYDKNEILRYKWYAENLISFLKNGSILDDLKSSMVEIRRISDSNRNSDDDGEMDDEMRSSTW